MATIDYKNFKEAFENDKDLCKLIKHKVDGNKKAHHEEYRNVGIGQAFYRGKHYGEWNSRSLMWVEEDINTDDRPRLVSNQCKVYVDQVVSKIVRYKPSLTATPQSNDDSDIEGSKAADEIMQHHFRVLDVNDKVERWVKACCQCGVGWLRIDWNPDLGSEVDEIEEDVEDRSETNVFGNLLKKKEEKKVKVTKIYQGDVEIKNKNPINIYFDSTALVFEDVKWIIEESMTDIVVLQQTFADKKDDIQADKDLKFGSTSAEELGLVRVFELFHRPTPDFPEGCYVIGTGNTILYKDKFPFEHKKLPYIPLIYSTRDDFLWGEGVVQPIMQLQVEYNKIKNIKLENENYSAAIKWLNPMSSNYDADLMTNEPGEVIDFDGQTPPSWSQPQQLDGTLYKALEEIRMEMQDIIGVNSTSQGKPPEGIRSGLAIQYLIENDDIRFAPLIRRMEKGIVDAGQMILELVKQYYEDEDERYYKIIGDNKQYQLKQFKKAALKGNYDVVVQNSNANPLSKAYKMDNIMQLIQYQILGVEDRPFIAEQLEVGNLKGVYEDIEIDRVRALKEIDDIMHGLPHDFLEFDDHDQHISVKEKYIKKTPLTPEQRQPILMAIQEHKDFIAQQQAAAMPGMQPGMGTNPMMQSGAALQGAPLSGNTGGQA